MNKTHVYVRPDPESVAQLACEWLADEIEQTIKERDRCVISLSGGSTPKRLYELLAEIPEDEIDWSKVHLIWGDERNVPLDDSESNFEMVRKAMLAPLGKRGPNVYPVPIDVDRPTETAERYESTLRALLSEKDKRWPRIDVVLLGLGGDAHTASLFPGTEILTEKSRWVASCYVQKLSTHRISLTAPVINSAASILFLVCGESKKQALQHIWHAAHNPTDYPAQLIVPTNGEVHWMLDSAAIEEISPPSDAEMHEESKS